MNGGGTSVKISGHAGVNAKSALDAPARAKIDKAAKEFEAILINTLMKSMRNTVPKSELGEGGFGNGIMESMFDEELSRHIAAKGNLGFGEMLYRNLLDRVSDGTSVVSEDLPVARSVSKAAHREKPIGRADKKESPALPKAQPKPVAAAPAAADSQGNWAPRTILTRIRAINSVVEEAAAMHGVDSTVIRAVIAAESGGNPNAQSSRDAKGLMQLRDSTAAAMGVTKVFDPRENVFGGTKYLRQLLDQFDGDLDLALASYNAGPAAVEKHGGIPPYRETKAYVKNVKSMIQAMSRTKEESNEGH
jgi:Rod binding domain-containing protein